MMLKERAAQVRIYFEPGAMRKPVLGLSYDEVAGAKGNLERFYLLQNTKH